MTTRPLMSPATIRNGWSRISPAPSARNAPRRAPRLASRAPLDLRVNTLKAERDKVAAHAVGPEARTGAWSPWGLRIRLAGRCQEPGDPCRAGLPQGHDRSAGRRFAAGRAVFRRQAGRAGGRSLRRRRRQDVGARGHDGEQGPDLRHRRRQAAAGADPRAPQALGRAQCAGADAEIDRRRDRRPHGRWTWC